jgi:hypothetical protein
MVFIHPVIIDSAALAHDVSQTKYEDMRVQQLKYQDGKLEDASKTALLPEFETLSPQPQSTPQSAPQTQQP